jgi:hypothetical protein
MNTQRMLVDWKTLKALGWPYSRTHTVRLMSAGMFPQSFKLTDHPNGHPVWRIKDVLNHFESRGLVLTSMDTAS